MLTRFDFSDVALNDLLASRPGRVVKIAPSIDSFRLQAAKETAFLVSRMHLQAAGVDLSTPEGQGLLLDHVQQPMSIAGTQALKQRLARAAFRARAKAARLSSGRHK